MHQSAIREQIFLSLPVQHHAWMENTVWLWEQGLDEEGLLTEGLSDETEKAFASWVSDKVPVGSNHRAGAEYRSRLIRVLGQRLLKKIEEEQQWK